MDFMELARGYVLALIIRTGEAVIAHTCLDRVLQIAHRPGCERATLHPQAKLALRVARVGDE
jgi:hypothetical protein